MDSTEDSASAKKVAYPGPDPNVKYPLNVVYCGECGLTTDLCEYSPNPDACKDWLNKNHPDIFTQLNDLQVNAAGEEADGDKKSAHQKRGGKGNPKSKKEKQPSKILITKEKRKGNKYVTIIIGLESNGIDLEVAKKFFAQRFSCGCSKGDKDDLTIQGDIIDNLVNVIPDKFPQITPEMIEIKEK
ncbi:density-regulated -like protein [Brachionus plicatilis]|uniref:Density-regulated-like protein n=1 Tax=Brachionus plicatilis TaxID=10195 RepID=A0A3M7RZI0_BRAPC|nr:density-regulated -like protein [Brachionus plicatilis]